MAIENYTEDTMIVGKKVIQVKRCKMNVYELKFFVDNPRVYTVLRNDVNQVPSQEEIELLMCKQDRVKELKESIKQNGGLQTPILVRESDNVVIEGNTRLAAYRILAKLYPVEFTMIDCKVLPADISDDTINNILTTTHILGTKDWSPYEQAGFLYRLLQKSKKPIELIAREQGIPCNQAKIYINVYEYMHAHNDLEPSRWSYYEELLKSSDIKKEIEEHPELENVIVKQIKTKKIEHAQDIRKIAKICKSKSKTSKKALEDYRKEEIDIYSAFSKCNSDFDMEKSFGKVREFKKFIIEDNLAEASIPEDKKPELVFDLKKIQQKIDAILKSLENGK